MKFARRYSLRGYSFAVEGIDRFSGEGAAKEGFTDRAPL
jgi:hypothetical protein